MNLYTRVESKIQHRPGLTTRRMAGCPSCGTRTEFSYGGEQTWPPEVAKRVGVPETVKLWHCAKCRSTFCETSLKF
jgi:hypothetical protein